MKSLTRMFSLLVFCFISLGVTAQNAEALLTKVVNKYGTIPNYKINIRYEANNDAMGFTNVQEGVLVVKRDKYILKFGSTETWLGDGKEEIIGTKEDDHSQIMYFCPGHNTEAIIDFGNIFSFFGAGHTASIVNGQLKLIPTGKAPYKELYLRIEGDDLTEIKAVDSFGTEHIYALSNFTTNAGNPQFTINRYEYAEKIDERKGCN